jgi:hypothetical protein
MLEMIKERQHTKTLHEQYDLFHSLVDANDFELEEGEKNLADTELIGQSEFRPGNRLPA